MKQKTLIIISSIVVLLLVAAIAMLVINLTKEQQATQTALQQVEQLKLDNSNLAMSGELAELNAQFQQHENDAIRLENDTILAKYNAAKARVEELINELNNQKVKDQAQINKLRDEISSLRGLLRHYVAMVDSLGKENAALKIENAEVHQLNDQLTSQVAEVKKENANLTEIKTLAEKLNVTNLQLTPLNKKGNLEKKISKAIQLKTTFTISPNNTTPAGHKTIYMRIVSPEGTLLGQAGTFKFEGASVAYTDKKTVEYTGQEMPGVTIYWNVNTALNPGEYTVELFADNFRLASRRFTLK